MPEIERVEKGNNLLPKKLVANLPEKEVYIIHVRNQKQALNHGLFFKNANKVITFDQKAWWKSNIDMNTELKKSKNLFWKRFLQTNK